MKLQKQIEFYYKRGDLLIIAKKIINNSQCPLDLVHDTIDRILCKASFYTEDNFLGYFKTVAYRVYLNSVRNETTRLKKIRNIDKSIAMYDPESTTHYRMMFDSICKSTSTRDKNILVGRLKGYTSKEIAEQLQMNVNSVFRIQHHIKQDMKQRYKHE